MCTQTVDWIQLNKALSPIQCHWLRWKERKKNRVACCGHCFMLGFLPAGELWCTWTVRVGVGGSGLVCGGRQWQVDCHKINVKHNVGVNGRMTLAEMFNHNPQASAQYAAWTHFTSPACLHSWESFYSTNIFISHQVLCNWIFLACVPMQTLKRQIKD